MRFFVKLSILLHVFSADIWCKKTTWSFQNLGCWRLMVFCGLLCTLDYNWYKNGHKHAKCLDIMLASKYNPVDVELTWKILCVLAGKLQWNSRLLLISAVFTAQSNLFFPCYELWFFIVFMNWITDKVTCRKCNAWCLLFVMTVLLEALKCGNMTCSLQLYFY